MKIKKIILSGFFILLAAGVLQAEENKNGERHIKLNGRNAIVVSTAAIRLGDLVDISSARVSDDEAVIALKKIEIEKSPAPGKESTISASKILEKMQENGVQLNSVTYVLPRVISIKRASRVVNADEIRTLIEDYFSKNGRDITIKNINYNNDMYIAPGKSTISVNPFNTTKSGQYGFNIISKISGEDDVRFDVTAQVEEWADLPVARRPLNRGSRIQAEDIMMARLNIASLPGDSAFEAKEVVGLETSGEISYGETFRKNKLVIPAVVVAGSKVTMLYKVGGLEATASGTALENGVLGQEIRIRNENSKKIITGKVIEPGLVGVSQ